jgi:hypothetical protein
MDEKTIRERLAHLHDELNDAHQATPAAQPGLNEILPDVKRLAEGDLGSSAGNAALSQRLEKLAVQFEAAHPAIAGSVRRLVDLLGEVGI